MSQFDMDLVEATRPLMDRILAILPGAAIAGGYLRDMLTGREVRDLDVFTETEPTPEQLADLGRFLADDPGLMQEVVLMDALDGGTLEPGQVFPEYTTDAGRISKIETLFKGGGVDVIVTNNLAAHIEEFPDSISKVYYDKDGLHITAEFAEAHDSKTITYRSNAGDKRLEKLKAKFPDYAVSLV